MMFVEDFMEICGRWTRYLCTVCMHIYIYPLHHNSIFVDGTSRHSVNMLILIVLLKQVFSIKNEIR